MADTDMLAAEHTDIDWQLAEHPVPYEVALAHMEDRAAEIAAGDARDQIWLLEHPPLYTAGTSAKDEDMLNAQFPVFKSGRGGQFT
ncbi:MAG: lipoate-protein ligase B, partial [Pseudomonadota bacterium]